MNQQKVYVLSITYGLCFDTAEVFDSKEKAEAAFEELVGVPYRPDWFEYWCDRMDEPHATDKELETHRAGRDYEQTFIVECEIQ